MDNLEDFLLALDEPELLEEFYKMKSILDKTRNLLFKNGGIAPASIVADEIREYDLKYKRLE